MNTFIERPKAKANEPSTDAPDDPNRLKRAQNTYEEALVQGAVMRRAAQSELENLKKIASHLGKRPIDRIRVLGCGDSWFVGIGLRSAFEHLLKVPTEPVQALDFALYDYKTSGPQELVIGISSGGNTPAVMQGLRRAKQAGALTIGLTNNPGTPITQEFDYPILVNATRKGWPTQASTASMFVLLHLTLELARVKKTRQEAELDLFESGLASLPGQAELVIQSTDIQMKMLAKELAEARFLFYCAGGPHKAAAAFGAAKVKELCPIHAEVFPLEEFHHYRTLKPGDPLILVVPDEASHERGLDTTQVGRFDGGKIFALVPQGEQEISAEADWSLELPSVDPLLAPILYSLPLHLFAYHLAMQKFEKHLGYTPAFPAQGE